MNYIKHENPLLYKAGWAFLGLGIILIVLLPFNNHVVLGINSLIKPLKFAISILIYCWSMAWLLSYYEDKKRILRYSRFAVFVMVFEQSIITVQAFRGKISHFNQTEIVGGILYGLMGVFIVWLTVSTLLITLKFKQKAAAQLSATQKTGIFLGLLFFVIFSFWGGLMSGLNTHTFGGEMGGPGSALTNWSLNHGDLRVAHFFGIHALQVVPMAAFYLDKKFKSASKALFYTQIVAWLYFAFVVFTAVQSLLGRAFMG